MPKLTISIPKYRHHRASGQSIVSIGGQDHYLGLHNSSASKEKYNRLVQEWLLRGRQPAAISGAKDPDICIAELCLAYFEEARNTYQKNGKPSSHLHNVQEALRHLNQSYSGQRVGEFGPLALKVIRQSLIDKQLSRSTINKHVGIIKQIFKWGTENELVPASVFHALQAVSGLRKGRSTAKEGMPVKPVPDWLIAVVRPYLSDQVSAMIELQMLTGMRPGEVCIMRGCDLETTASIWTYTPFTHKTEHHDIERPIYLGPKGQTVVARFLKSDLQAFLFDPRDAEAARNGKRRASRRSPMTPSQAARKKKTRPKFAPKEHYTTESYRRAIARACRMADKNARKDRYTSFLEMHGVPLPPEQDGIIIPQWHPHQLRHNAATRFRKEFDLDGARVVLGHRSAAITEVYAEIDHAKAKEIMAKVG